MDENTKTYLIPANSKKSILYFGLFNKFDLIMFAIGISLTLILLLTLPVDKLLFAVIALAPGLITGFLVLPIPNYHNMLTIIREGFNFFTQRRNFIWKGWCFNHGEDKE